MCRRAAHPIDDVIDLIGKTHRIGGIEPHDEGVIEELVYLVDQLVGTSLEDDDARKILTIRRAKVRRTFDSNIGELGKQVCELFILRRSEETRDRTRCLAQADIPPHRGPGGPKSQICGTRLISGSLRFEKRSRACSSRYSSTARRIQSPLSIAI